MILLKNKRLFIEKYETVTSTNDLLKEKALSGAPAGTILVAKSQTAGRGRMGRKFYSPAGKGVYLSILLDDLKTATDNLCITAHTAVAVAKTIEKYVKKQTQIKWVNDIYLNGRKVCGILAEKISDVKRASARIIVGIGINLQEPEGGYPKELGGIAGAVFDRQDDIDQDRFIKDLITAFFEDNHDLLGEYKERNMLAEKDVVIKQGDEPAYTAHVIGIDESFGLRVCLSDGTETVLRSGEISVREKVTD